MPPRWYLLLSATVPLLEDLAAWMVLQRFVQQACIEGLPSLKLAVAIAAILELWAVVPKHW